MRSLSAPRAIPARPFPGRSPVPDGSPAGRKINRRKGTMRSLAWLMLAAFMLYNPVPTSSAEREVIVVGGDEWCPYNCGVDDDLPGFCVEITREVFKARGIGVTYVVLPWEDAVRDARAGKVNAIIGAIKEDAPDFIFPEREIAHSRNILIVRSGASWKFAGLESLNGKKIGVVEGYAYGTGFDEYFKEHPGIAVPVTGEEPKEILLKKLLSKEIDAFIEDPNVLLNFLRVQGTLDLIDVAGGPAESDPVYIAFSPAVAKSAVHAKILSDGIAALRASGRYAEILKKYGLKEEK